MARKGFIFSLDAFFALIVFMVAFAILLYTNRLPFHYYYLTLQAKVLASDLLNVIIEKGIDLTSEQGKRDACFLASTLLGQTEFRFAIYVGDEALPCSSKEEFHITKQSATSLVLVNYNEGENPYRYFTCRGDNIPCEPLNRTHPVEPPELLPVKVVVFI